MNSTSSGKITPASSRIVTHWRRFSTGLWRVTEGDIAAAYCADTFPKIKVFMHEGHLFTNCGCNYSKYIAAEVNCYPLIPPDEYRGEKNVPYSYEGREAAHKGRVFKLGAKVLFVASDPTLEEWRNVGRGRCPARRRKCAACSRGNPLPKANPNKLILRYDTEYQNHPVRDHRNLRLWPTRPQIGCRL